MIVLRIAYLLLLLLALFTVPWWVTLCLSAVYVYWYFGIELLLVAFLADIYYASNIGHPVHLLALIVLFIVREIIASRFRIT